jgi:hypothetical protein
MYLFLVAYAGNFKSIYIHCIGMGGKIRKIIGYINGALYG